MGRSAGRVDRAGRGLGRGRTGIAGATAQQNYPAVDISKLIVQELPAGTPQTSAVVATTDAEGGGQSRALASDYVEKEFLVKGEASTYEGKLGGPVEVTQTNVPYATRVLVHSPKDPKKFSGRVVVEPFNTSNGGKDYDVVWSMLAPMLQQRGDAWVGVTERASAGAALKTADPTRYADINVPSNDVAWDVLAQVGAAVRKGGAQSPLPGLDPKHLYMAGYSQSGVDTAGFAIGLAKHYGTSAGKPMFDGYFPAAQAASATPLKAGTSVLPVFEYPVWPAVGVPVVNLEDESGVDGIHGRAPGRRPGHARAEGVHQRVVGDDATRRLGQEGRPVPALRGRGHAARTGWQRRLRRARLDVPDHLGGPGHVRAPQPLGRDRPEAAARAPREDGRDRQELQGVGRRERQRPRRGPVAVPRRRARPLRRAGARPDHLRARRPRGGARQRRARRRSTRASTPT